MSLKDISFQIKNVEETTDDYFKEEMQKIDSALATIQKITGMKKDEIKAFGEAAYETAISLGVKPSEYLEASAKVINDTNTDPATQYLLSGSFGHEYQCSLDNLIKALDSANECPSEYEKK